MDFLLKALEALPSVATSPYALIGYLVTVGAWSLAMHRSVRLKVLMARLKDIPQNDRAKVVQLELGEVLPQNISAEQWLRARNHRHFAIAGIALLITLTVVGAVSVNAALELARVAEQTRAKEAELATRKAAIASKRQELDHRMQAIQDKIAAAKLEFRRGATGFKFAPQDQKQLALAIMQNAADEIIKFQAEQVELQKQIDALPLQ